MLRFGLLLVFFRFHLAILRSDGVVSLVLFLLLQFPLLPLQFLFFFFRFQILLLLFQVLFELVLMPKLVQLLLYALAQLIDKYICAHIEEESLDDFVCFLGLPERLKSVLQRQPEADQKLFLSGLRGGRVLVLHGYINFGAAQNFQKNLEMQRQDDFTGLFTVLNVAHDIAIGVIVVVFFLFLIFVL